jgi:hypothetical protein
MSDMEDTASWLHVLVAQPLALASLVAYLKKRERECSEYALDVDEKLIADLRGKRTAFRDIQAYISNNLVKVKG